MKKLCLVITAISLIAATEAKTIYKIVAADGSLTYSDKPIPGSEAVSLGKLNTAEPLAKVTQQLNGQAQATNQYQLTILSPAHEATIRDNSGEVNISAAIHPPIPGVYELNIDGNIVATNNSGNFQLKDIQRGAHHLQISFSDNTGKILASSEQQTFFMHKASALINSN